MVNYKDIGVRAVKTFVQAFLATVAVGLASANSADELKALGVASVAAGISAAWNFVKETL